MVTEQGYIHDLTKVIKKNLKEGAYKKTPKQIKQLESQKSEVIKENRILGWEKRKLRKEREIPGLPKKAITAIDERIKEIKEEYRPLNVITDKYVTNNEISMAKGQPFYINISLSGFTKERWGKKRDSYNVKSTQFEKRAPGEIEAALLRLWKSSVEEGIETDKRPTVVKGLTKLLVPIEENLNVAEGILDIETMIEKEKYPIMIHIIDDMVKIYITGAK